VNVTPDFQNDAATEVPRWWGPCVCALCPRPSAKPISDESLGGLSRSIGVSMVTSVPARYNALSEAVTRRAADARTVLGVLSLSLWWLSLLYAQNSRVRRARTIRGGGTLSLTALATMSLGRRTTLVFLLG